MAYTTINKSTDHFNTKLYTGDGNSPRSITGIGFAPDFVWNKNRRNANSNTLGDVVRGTGKTLLCDGNNSEFTNNSYGYHSSFDSDGFAITGSAASAGGDNVNKSGNNYVVWNWKAGGGQGSSNTDGSINTTYTSANTTAGFSISTYTGTGYNATVGHGLGVAPELVIIKDRDNTIHWPVGSTVMGWNKNMYLSLNSAQQTANHFQDTPPTNSLMYLSTDAAVNGSGNNYVMYCFAGKTGYSKIGSYTGNGSADGTFIYTGFKPAWVMVKRTDSTNNWMIIDNKRTPSNTGTVPEIFADSNSAENNSTDGRFDYLSNGLKARGTNAVINASGGTYLYMAFGQSLVGSNNVPCIAR